MGASAEVWSAELRRTGRVVFPIRRLTVVVRCFLPGVPIGIGVFTRPEPSFLAEDIMAGVLVIVWVGLVGFGVWHLVTGRPAVTVDDEGVRVGRRKFLPWGGIAPIHVPLGHRLFTELRLMPHDARDKKLTIGRDQLRDVPAFARWLEDERLEKGAAWL
ncbi:hypothetical protein AB0H36_21745 [Kribbella sp. NPDC050820]|uniref:hypothetical protein n=1 Tax=Kribbella sp. NPDC050820 TaxID=3155408 RepID=UPI0034000DEB